MLQHQSAFVDALRSGRQMRKRIFDTIEQRHACDFRNSRVGPGLYEDLLSAVRNSGAAEAIKEFENRFSPLLNSDPSRDNAEAAALANRRTRGWGMISAMSAVAFLGALIVGFGALKIIAAERPTVSAVKAIEPASEAMPLPAVAPESPIATTKVIEPTTETTEAAPPTSVEQERSLAE